MVPPRVESAVRRWPLRLPRVCVSLAALSPAELVEKAEAVSRDNSFIEFRLDHLKQPAQALPKIKEFLGFRPYVIAIATCRRAAAGGKFRGSIASELEILGKAADAGCQFVDVEIETAESAKTSELQKLQSKAKVILSFHDFRGTKKLERTFEQMSEYAADIYKVVTTANSLSDNLAMFRFLETHSGESSIVGLCMGEQGILSRVLTSRSGGAFTFAAASIQELTAPGQATARTLTDLYRVDHIDAATKVYGVAGDPVEHSLSPVMMNAAFRRENLNSVYLPLRTKSVEDLVNCIRELPLSGVSITMPHKQSIMEYLDNCEPLCQRIGACNTVIRSQDGKLYGFNTDVAGIVRPLQQRIHLAGAKILVLGAGGAGRAAVFALKERGAEVFILNRTPATAQKLARQAQAKTVRRDDLKKLHFDVIINATPVGMGASGESPLNEKEMNARIAMDMVYNPVETPFLKLARAKQMALISGLEMFVQQGARQFEIWTGKPAPAAEMQQVVVNALQARMPGAPEPVAKVEEAKPEPTPEKRRAPAAVKRASIPRPKARTR